MDVSGRNCLAEHGCFCRSLHCEIMFLFAGLEVNGGNYSYLGTWYFNVLQAVVDAA